MSEVKPKSCPFCGGEAEESYSEKARCKAECIGLDWIPVELWNRRATPPSEVKPHLELCKGCCGVMPDSKHTCQPTPAPAAERDGWLTREELEDWMKSVEAASLFGGSQVAEAWRVRFQALCRMALYALDHGGKL